MMLLGISSKKNVGLHARLLPLGHYPLLAVERDDVFRSEVVHVYVRKSREARKHEHVPYKFQTTDAEILVAILGFPRL